jgi:hypothetical protein
MVKKNNFGSNAFKTQREEIIYLLTIILFKYKSDLTYIIDTINTMKKKYTDFYLFLIIMKIIGFSI